MQVAREAFGLRDDDAQEALTQDRQERADNLRNLCAIGAAAAFGAFAIAVLSALAPVAVMTVTFAVTVGLAAAHKFCDFNKLVR